MRHIAIRLTKGGGHVAWCAQRRDPAEWIASEGCRPSIEDWYFD